MIRLAAEGVVRGAQALFLAVLLAAMEVVLIASLVVVDIPDARLITKVKTRLDVATCLVIGNQRSGSRWPVEIVAMNAPLGGAL